MDAGGEKFLLINPDLIGVEGSFVQRIRSELNIDFDIPEEHIQIFATHTHSGPGTVHLNFCGEYAPDYIDFLQDKILEGCRAAMKDPEPCTPEFREASLELGRNRRYVSDDPLDNPLRILSWRKHGGELKSVLLNYAMHPVCLKGTGISADYPGWVSKALGEELPGQPLVLFGLGAAGDIDPPGVGVSYEQMQDWGSRIAGTAMDCLLNGSNEITLPDGPLIRLESATVEIPLRSLDIDEIDRYAEKYLSDSKWNDEFGPVFPQAVEKWREDMKRKVQNGPASTKAIELNCLMIGQLAILFVNAELFSEFENLVRSKIHTPIMVISCTNGLEGYLPDRKEYAHGGYEVETAIFFYNSFLPEAGSLEMLAGKSVRLINRFL